MGLQRVGHDWATSFNNFLQPPDILWIHWRVYNFIANANKGLFFLPPSDAYVRSFLYLLYTVIKLCYTKALSDQASSLAPDWILLLRGPRIPASWFNNLSSWGSSGILQDKVRMLGALVLCSLSEHVFCCAVLILWFACVNEWNALCEASEEPCSEVPRWSHTAYGRNLLGVYTDLPMPRGTQCLLWGTNQKWAKCVDWTLLFQSNFLVALTIS